MARPRPSLSLPIPAFEYSAPTATLPKTPDQHADEQLSTAEPPPPPRQAFKLKRRRVPTVPLNDAPLLSYMDSAIPTIEMSETALESMSHDSPPTPTSDGLLAPLPACRRMVTPSTPAPRFDDFTPATSPVHEWALINDCRDNKRPAFQRSASLCSSFSDSSVSSAGSSAFSAPNNSSCTSPESVATDPFTEEDITKGDSFTLSPPQESSLPSAKRVKRHRHVKWTLDMDQHIENTYMMYLRDPRVTPFKTLPGIPPPLGVCSRVASKARRTWIQQRAITTSSLDTILESVRATRDGSPDTIRPGPSGDKYHRQQWPSDAATRRRLRKLVKSKPQLSAHYQRLLRTRSPSPFPTSSATSRSSEPPSGAFSGRDMKLSLITSTAPSMQPEGPLVQLSSDDAVKEEGADRPDSRRSARPANWFARIGRSKAHQKSLSLQSELGFNDDGADPSNLLASPFDEESNRTHLLQSMTTTKSLGRSVFNGKSPRPPSLEAPIELSGAPTAPRSLKRRFKSDEEKPRRPVLADVFGPPGDDVGIVRNRGFSVGAARANEVLAMLSEPTPPPPSSSTDYEMTEAPALPDLSHLGPVGSRSAPRRLAEPVPRLGSPFLETPLGNQSYNTFPRSYLPTPSNSQPFYNRLRELAARNSSQQSS